jgi:hypothetical protein
MIIKHVKIEETKSISSLNVKYIITVNYDTK